MNLKHLHRIVHVCRIKLFVICLLLFPFISFAQYPQYFSYNSENGLPGNEIYSIEQDRQGFIWIGTDAGLYKYNGVRYISYKCPDQKSKSIAGLSVSSSGRLYCYNFQGQLFVLENDSLKELKHPAGKIASPACDGQGNVIITHDKGISLYNENTKSWKTYTNFGEEAVYVSRQFTRSAKVNAAKQVRFISTSGLGTLHGNSLSVIPNNDFKKLPLSSLILECWKTTTYIFSSENNSIFKERNGKLELATEGKLNAILKNRKITNVNRLKDDRLWISTYNGMISYDPAIDSCRLFYPGIAFSDCLLDREGNYWFSTLQNGLLRVPQLSYVVWNTEFNSSLKNDKITHVCGHEGHIYFTNINGLVGDLDSKNGSINYYHTGNDADVQCLFYDTDHHCLYFNQSNKMHRLKNAALSAENMYAPSVKSFLVTDHSFLMGSSLGLMTVGKNNDTALINTLWTRDLFYDQQAGLVYASTDKGLLKYRFDNDKLSKEKLYFENTQILNSDKDEIQNRLYVLLSSGSILSINEAGDEKLITALPKTLQANKLKAHAGKLYIATNKGLYVYDTRTGSWKTADQLSGLSSANIQDMYIGDKSLWLATGNGLQQIPFDIQVSTTRALIYNRAIAIGNLKINGNPEFDYGQTLIISPEVSAYSSQGDFQYAYRLKNGESGWNYLPGNIEKIEIPNIPDGAFELELKAIDHLGRDSENILKLIGYVKPPSWRSWWFYILVSLLILCIAFVFFKYRIKLLRKKQINELKQIQLENDLKFSQETALKAQMNPHFLFNVLNSIKGYIYENDKKNAVFYLSGFSDLIRKILIHSSSPEITLQEEIEILKLYVELEAMLIQDNFKYTIEIDDRIDVSNVKIPALLIQPYVENALKHGLRHKKGMKELSVVFKLSLNENCLIIAINDNGIGRKASYRLNSQHTNKHQSFATSATEKRIELLNSNKKNIVSVKIIDHISDDNEALGTGVILTINLNYTSRHESGNYR